MKIRFGVGVRNGLSGAVLAVRVTQSASMVCALFLLAVSS